MKKTTKLYGAILIAVAGIAVATPKATITKAAETDTNTGAADIEFVEATYGDKDTGGVIVPNSTDTIVDTDVDLKDGAFVVQGVSKLDFGKHEATTGVVRAFAKPVTANAEKEDEVTGRPNWVQFKDNRSIDDHSYTLSAKITKDFSGEIKGKARTLTGAVITYTNPILVADAQNAALIPTELKGLATTAAVNNQETTVFSNVQPDKGRGRYAIYFGEKGSADKDPAQSVSLMIPTNQEQEVQVGQYSATVTWTLAETPQEAPAGKE
ncbi:WxL domain-containing protein [Enterococcus sp. LJL99]